MKVKTGMREDKVRLVEGNGWMRDGNGRVWWPRTATTNIQIFRN